MNFSLHLQAIFTFIRQNKATLKKHNPYTYTRIVLDICLLCTWTQGLWICFCWKGVLETQSMHIYIYTYIKGCEVRCCQHVLFAFSPGYDFFSRVWYQLPLIQPYHSLSAARFASGFYL